MPVKYKYLILFFLLLLLWIPCKLQAQNKEIKNDTTVIDSTKLHSPKLATLMSACLPGLGQVYNKKYWKVPLIYTGFGVIGYFIKTNGDYYNKYRTAYIYRKDKDTTTIDHVFPGYSDEDILSNRDSYRRYRDLSYIIGVIWYVFNILDATVDAHLFYFNINEDLSLNLKPSIVPLYYKNTSSALPGLTLSFNIGKIYNNKKPKTYL
jgi:hypothetical protein